MMRDIKITVQENSAMLKKLLKENTVPEVPSSTSILSKDVKTNVNLPLRSLDDVARIEIELKNSTTRQKYVEHLSRIRGFGQKDVIKNIMQQVLSDDLAKQFNWQGRGDKKPFSKLILTDVIRDAASKQSVMREDCEAEIKNYLWYVADRIGRKRPRDWGGTFEMAKEGQKEIKEYKEWSYPLDTVLPGIKRQRLKGTQGMSNNQLQPLLPVTSASTSRMSADDEVEIYQMLRDIKSKVQQNSTMLKQFKDNTVSEAPSSTCVPSKDIKANLKLPLRSFEDVARTETEIKNATTRKKYVSDTPRPDGIPVSFYKDKIQDLIPYIKMLYDRIHSGAFNCSKKHFNETVKIPHDDSQHFFNVDYLIIATILAKRLDDYLDLESKCRVPKKSATVMISPKTFCTEMRLSCIKDEIEKQKQSNPNLYQDFLIMKNLLRDAPKVDSEFADVSVERDKLLDQGCPLTPVLITLALKCFASALAGHLKQHDILVFKESMILCIQPEDLEKITAAVKNRANEVFYIKELSRGNVDGEKLKYVENESKAGDWYEREAERLMDNTEQESEASWSKTNKGNNERSVCEEHDFVSVMQREDISVEGDERLTMYAVVTLQDSDEVMVVPLDWLSLDKKQCYWPPFKSTEKCMEAVQKIFKPETAGKPWEKLNIRFHRDYVTFNKAKEGQKEIQEQKERLGGFGQKDVINNIMQKVLSDDLAIQFNWQGRGEKKAFSKLNLTDVIRDAASKQNVVRAECETEMKNYLWSIPDRIGRKRPRDCGGMPSPTLLDSSFQSEIGMSFLDD
ncbi:hypothetical protein ROHU_029204 [Labeo rohita]|uniref:DUF4806 domain-containing protein n=1 Tax=Labeo rohita TaxID=84645 RepID=A0A498M0D4_LABRO|nr:hypothetical protein ROHU_029204 [Labeo rohita]